MTKGIMRPAAFHNPKIIGSSYEGAKDPITGNENWTVRCTIVREATKQEWLDYINLTRAEELKAKILTVGVPTYSHFYIVEEVSHV